MIINRLICGKIVPLINIANIEKGNGDVWFCPKARSFFPGARVKGGGGGAALLLSWQTAAVAALAAALLSWISGRLGASGAMR